jgi:hypothetical protein
MVQIMDTNNDNFLESLVSESNEYYYFPPHNEPDRSPDLSVTHYPGLRLRRGCAQLNEPTDRK